MFQHGHSPLLRQIVGDCIAQGGRCTLIDLGSIARRLGSDLADSLAAAKIGGLLAHGVARPQRPHKLESLFVFAAAAGKSWRIEHRVFFEYLLPHIHITYLRVQAIERELGAVAVSAPAARVRDAHTGITEREREILGWMREGKSNPEIGAQLGISALTVKNHLQKILRKLGASNRTQAVARAINMNLIGSNRRIDSD